MNFITLLDYVGTFAFAISGIRLASAKHFDWFGAYVVGFVTPSAAVRCATCCWACPLSGCKTSPTWSYRDSPSCS